MALFGRIDNNVVVELFREPEGFTIDECFHPIVRAMFKQVPEGTMVNSTWDEESQTWTPPPQPKATK